MAHRLLGNPAPYGARLALVVLLLAGVPVFAQPGGQPMPPQVFEKSKPSEPPAPPKELAAQEIDALIEKAFGKDCAELKRPIRIVTPIMILTAESIAVARLIRLDKASLALAEDNIVLRGDPIIVTTDEAISKASDLRNRRIVHIEVRANDRVITLVNRDTTFTTVGSKIGSSRPEKVEPEPEKGGVPPTSFSGPVSMEVRFQFKLDHKAPLTSFLPTPLKTTPKLPHWTNEDLAKVPELAIGESISKELPKHQAMEATAHALAKINHLNAKKRDGFLLAMLEHRSDLRGLPFLMGDECRTREKEAKIFAFLTDALHSGRKKGDRRDMDAILEGLFEIHAVAQGSFAKEVNGKIPLASQDEWYRATVAATMQIFMPESAKARSSLAKLLTTIPHIDATKALARLAIFSPEDEVRAAAIEGLKLRREKDYTDILNEGLRYPLPAVAKRSAEALVKLERKDVLAKLIDVLESSDPRLPVKTVARSASEGSYVVRELVKVNHHKNCLLCHAPGNTDNTPEGVLKVAVPLPGEPLPKPSEGGGYQSTPPPSPDMVVRIDMTYLRQDFSMMMPVSEAHPWPEMQRFDFLVRTRQLTAAEAQAYEPCCEEDEPGRLSPYHRAALYALRELTGRDTAPTAEAWRKLLKISK